MAIEYSIEKYYDMVYRIAKKRLHNDSDAQDITQDVFVKLMQYEDKFETEEHLKHWLLRVTINSCNKHYNSGWMKHKTSFADLEDEDSFANSLRYSATDTYHIENEVMETVNSLPSQYQEVITLFYFKDLSMKEICDYTGMNENTVKTRLRRARELFRQCMNSKSQVQNAVFVSLQEEISKYFAHYNKQLKLDTLENKVAISKNTAVLAIDMANLWTRPGSPFSCDADDAVAHTYTICETARLSKIETPIIFSITDFSKHKNTADTILAKMPVQMLDEHNKENQYNVDSRLHVRTRDHVMWKPGISCFQGTILDYMLKNQGIDTLIITGVTVSAAVRLAVFEAIYHGYRVIVASDAVADRIVGAKDWNLFDISRCSADVMTTKQIVAMIEARNKELEK